MPSVITQSTEDTDFSNILDHWEFNRLHHCMI